jgi:hypothetical protein
LSRMSLDVRCTATTALCGDAEKRLQNSKATLVACAFELEACAPDKLSEATASVDDSRAAAAAAWDAFDAARTGAANASADELAESAQRAACRSRRRSNLTPGGADLNTPRFRASSASCPEAGHARTEV